MNYSDMEISEVSPETYQKYISNPYVIFNSVIFNQHVSSKCDAVKYFLFSDTKPRLGLIAGLRGRKLLSPFSAPYGGFSLASASTHMTDYSQALELLCRYARENNIHSIQITLPPTFYHDTFISKQANALICQGFHLQSIDVNSNYFLSDFDNTYLDQISYSAKKNYKNSLRYGLIFQKVEQLCDQELCYQIIKENREAKGREVKMSFDEVMRTVKIIPADLFVVRHQEEGVASAIIFHVNPEVAQVIYWGSRPQFDYLRPTNFMSYNIWEYYKQENFQIVDVGPSSSNGVPDAGLVDFKESLGCKLSMKLNFSKEFLS